MYISLTKESENKLIKMIENDSFSVDDILIFVDRLMYNEYKEGYDEGWKDGYDYRIKEEH